MQEPEDLAVSAVDFVGPFQSYDVIVKGRRVPFLRAQPLDGGGIDVTLDRRFALVLSVAEAERFIPFLADAIAVASGYTSHPTAEGDGPNFRHPFPRVRPLVPDSG
jgi:hypothetical protein